MQNLFSIQTSNRLFETGGSRPILLTCNDLNDYVCKYNMGNGPATRLMCEYLGASYLKLWRLNVPDFALVSVNREHIPKEYNINGYYFDTTCFGLKFSRDYADISDFGASISHQQRRAFPNKENLIYIALFDIWLANEDRNHNNYNLLIDIEVQRDFIPIDHETILNSRVLDKPIAELTYEDSIISSPLFLNLFGASDFKKPFIERLKTEFILKVSNCRKKTRKIINELPNDWNIDKKQLENKLISELYVNSWLENSFNLFLVFLQRNLNIKENAIAL
jgi:hypothetical protein